MLLLAKYNGSEIMSSRPDAAALRDDLRGRRFAPEPLAGHP